MEKLSLRKVTAVLGLAAGSLSLAACGSDVSVTPNVPATVVEHHHTDAYTTFMPVMVGKVVTMMPIYHPEVFELDVYQCGHKEFMNQNPDGCGDIVIDVSESTYKQFADGSTIVFNK